MFDKNYDVTHESQLTPIVTIHKKVSYQSVFTHMHYHDDFEILYIVKGKVNMIIDGVKFSADSGSIILINPYETHYGEMLDDSLEYYCIDFSLTILSLPNENEIISRNIKYVNHLISTPDTAKHIINVHKAYKQLKNLWDLEAKANLLMLFYYFADKTVYTGKKHKEIFEKKVIDYVTENYSSQITSNDVSNSLGYNQNYFCRAFKKSFGCRFCDYLNDYRIKIAKSMLSDKTPAEIWEKLGFSSYYYFSAVFKKTTGTTPAKYKATHFAKK